jgi:mRNA interferase RelE/StbE
MPGYTINFTRQALKSLQAINHPFYSNLKAAVTALADNPCPIGFKKLKGRKGYRIRVGNYRVVSGIFDHLFVIEIITPGHRKNVYN